MLTNMKMIAKRVVKQRPIKLSLVGNIDDFKVFAHDREFADISYVNSMKVDINANNITSIISPDINGEVDNIKPTIVIMVPYVSFTIDDMNATDIEIADTNILSLCEKYLRIIAVPVNFNFKHLFEKYSADKLEIIKGYGYCTIVIQPA